MNTQGSPTKFELIQKFHLKTYWTILNIQQDPICPFFDKNFINNMFTNWQKINNGLKLHSKLKMPFYMNAIVKSFLYTTIKQWLYAFYKGLNSVNQQYKELTSTQAKKKFNLFKTFILFYSQIIQQHRRRFLQELNLNPRKKNSLAKRIENLQKAIYKLFDYFYQYSTGFLLQFKSFNLNLSICFMVLHDGSWGLILLTIALLLRFFSYFILQLGDHGRVKTKFLFSIFFWDGIFSRCTLSFQVSCFHLLLLLFQKSLNNLFLFNLNLLIIFYHLTQLLPIKSYLLNFRHNRHYLIILFLTITTAKHLVTVILLLLDRIIYLVDNMRIFGCEEVLEKMVLFLKFSILMFKFHNDILIVEINIFNTCLQISYLLHK